jgi:hypothetical protein
MPLGGTWGIFKGVARGINNRGDVVGNGRVVETLAGGMFVWSRGAFRFLDPSFRVSDINEHGTAVGGVATPGFIEEGALVPKAGTQVPVTVLPGAPTR